MANTLLTASTITKEALRQLKNQLVFTKKVNRQYDDSFAQKDAKVGSVINIRKPTRYSVSDGVPLVIQDTADQSVALTLDSRKHVGMNFSSQDLTLSIDEFAKRYITPAVTALANKVDLDGLDMVRKNVFNCVGTPGTTPATLLPYLQAKQKIFELGGPDDDNYSTLINPAAQATIVNALNGLFQSSEQIKKQYERGEMGIAAGSIWKMAQNIAVHKVGPLGGTPLANGAGVDAAATLSTKGWTAAAASRLKQGDVFTIANVNAVNPQSKALTGALQQFVVTADFSSDGSGNGTVAISPPLLLTGAYQNIDALPVDGAAITVVGAANTNSPTNLIYHEDAFVLGCVDLMLPEGVSMASRASDPDSGLSIRFVRDYDINSDNMPCRLDVLYGWKAVYPELACRIQG